MHVHTRTYTRIHVYTSTSLISSRFEPIVMYIDGMGRNFTIAKKTASL